MPLPTAPFFTTLPSPLGPLTLRGTPRGLSGLFLADHRHGPSASERARWQPGDTLFATARVQLTEYFAGQRTAFDLPLDEDAIGGTPFQRRVWRVLQTIPYGQTLTYGELSRQLGQPLAIRAVGLANGRNPVSIIVPCHRVVGANGALTGYSGGIVAKQWLLKHEKATACTKGGFRLKA